MLPPLPFRGRVRRALTDLVCLLGITVAKAVGSFRANRAAIVPEKILVVRRGGLGDVLMATPLLRALREHFPSARVYVLTSKQALPGLNGCSWVDQVLEVPSSTKDWLPLLHKLRKERIDTAFILHRFFAPSLLTLLAGIPRRLGFEWKNHGFALTDSIPFSPGRSQTLQIGQLLALVGKPAADTSMEFTVGEDAIRCAREILEGWGFDPAKPLVGIHPGGAETAISSDPARRWLPERFGRLADLLVQHGGVQVVMLQGPGDEPFVDEALRNMNARPLGIASGLPLAVFAAVMRECVLVVVNDSGPMHMAAAQKVPVVAIMGPTHPAYNPPRGGIHKVVWAGVHCSPCYNPEEYIFGTRARGKKRFECWRSTHECMVAITAEEVYSVVVRQLRVFENEPGQGRIKAAAFEGYRNAVQISARTEHLGLNATATSPDESD
jgi:heptosyltransferase-2